MKNSCIDVLATELGLDKQTTGRIYGQVLNAMDELGLELPPHEVRDEFIRHLDAEMKAEIADGAKNKIKQHYKEKTVREVRQRITEQRTYADISVMLSAAQSQGKMRTKTGFAGSLGTTDPVKALRSLIIGSNAGVPFARKSISATRDGIEQHLLAPLINLMRELPEVMHLQKYPVTKARIEKLSKISRDVADVIISGKFSDDFTDNPHMQMAQKIGKVYTAVMDESVDILNSAGAATRKMRGYVPNAHDFEKIGANKARWIDSMLENMDWERSFTHKEPTAKSLQSHDEKVKFLNRVWKSMQAHGDKFDSEADFRIENATEVRFEHERDIYFKDGKAWQAYHDEFGTTGDVMAAMLSQLQTRARMVSLMKHLGPDPEKGLMRIVERLAYDIEHGKIKMSPEVEDVVKRQLKAINMHDGKRITGETVGDILNPADGGISMAYAEVAGETLAPKNAQIAKVASAVRITKMMAVLGRAVLASVVDVPNAWMSMMRKGMPSHMAFSELVSQYKNHWKIDDMAEVSMHMAGYYDDVIGAFHSRFTFDEPGVFTRMQGMYFRVSGLSYWTDIQRGALARTNMRWLGHHVNTSFADLPLRLRETLSHHGIGAGKWDVFRRCSVEAADGKSYLVPEGLDHIDFESLRSVAKESLNSLSDEMPFEVRRIYEQQVKDWIREPQKFKEQLKLEMNAMLRDEVRFGIIEADDKTRYYLLRGTKPGSLSGEILRFASMFKSYPVGLVDRAWSRQIYMNSGGKGSQFLPSNMRVDMDMAKWVAATTTAGYLSLALSDMSKGYEPRPLYGEHGFDTFLAAMQKGGAGGIYGDVMADMLSQYDKSWMHKVIGMAGGPVADTGMDALGVIYNGLTLNEKWAHKAYKFTLNNTPYQNIWWGRLAFDNAIGWNLEEFLNPNAVAKRQGWNSRNLGRDPLFKP